MTTQEILHAAQGAKLPLALADADTKNAALEAMAVALIAAQDKILDANKQDVENARGRVSDVMLDRLALTPSRLTDMAKGMREVAALPDPVGAVLRKIVRPNGLLIEKTAVPMGVIAIIYESRPNVTSDAAALAIKAGSACILRCGRDAWASCHAIVEALRAGLRRVCLLYTSDAADELDGVDLGGRRIIKKKFFQAEDGIRDQPRSRGLGDVYKRQGSCCAPGRRCRLCSPQYRPRGTRYL